MKMNRPTEIRLTILAGAVLSGAMIVFAIGMVRHAIFMILLLSLFLLVKFLANSMPYGAK